VRRRLPLEPAARWRGEGRTLSSRLILPLGGGIENWPSNFFGNEYSEMAAMTDAALDRQPIACCHVYRGHAGASGLNAVDTDWRHYQTPLRLAPVGQRREGFLR